MTFNLDFTQEDILQEIPVSIPSSDGGVQEFKLVSLNGQDATTYENARAACIKFDKEGNPIGFNKVADLAPMLVGMCLRRPDGGSVSRQVVGNFPYRVLKKLFETAQQINGLNEEVRYTNSMVKVFSQTGSPVDMEIVRNWLREQDQSDKDVEVVSLLFKESDDELAKNSQSGTMHGS